jgi:hypothetical protein
MNSILGLCIVALGPGLILYGVIFFAKRKISEIKDNIQLYFHNDGQLELIIFAPFFVTSWALTIIYYLIHIFKKYVLLSPNKTNK